MALEAGRAGDTLCRHHNPAQREVHEARLLLAQAFRKRAGLERADTQEDPQQRPRTSPTPTSAYAYVPSSMATATRARLPESPTSGRVSTGLASPAVLFEVRGLSTRQPPGSWPVPRRSVSRPAESSRWIGAIRDASVSPAVRRGLRVGARVELGWVLSPSAAQDQVDHPYCLAETVLTCQPGLDGDGVAAVTVVAQQRAQFAGEMLGALRAARGECVRRQPGHPDRGLGLVKASRDHHLRQPRT